MPYTGWLTLYQRPWEELDPNPMGMSEGVEMFKDFAALKPRCPPSSPPAQSHQKHTLHMERVAAGWMDKDKWMINWVGEFATRGLALHRDEFAECRSLSERRLNVSFCPGRFGFLKTRQTPYPPDVLLPVKHSIVEANKDVEEEEVMVMGRTVAFSHLDTTKGVQYGGEKEEEDDDEEGTKFMGHEMGAVMAMRKFRQRAFALAVVVLIAVGAGLLGCDTLPRLVMHTPRLLISTQYHN